MGVPLRALVRCVCLRVPACACVCVLVLPVKERPFYFRGMTHKKAGERELKEGNNMAKLRENGNDTESPEMMSIKEIHPTT